MVMSLRTPGTILERGNTARFTMSKRNLGMRAPTTIMTATIGQDQAR